MHTNSTTVRIPRSQRVRTTTHHTPRNTRGNRTRQHAAQAAQTVRYFGEG